MADDDPKERMTLYVSAALRKRIEALAKEAGQTISIWVSRACIAKADKASE